MDDPQKNLWAQAQKIPSSFYSTQSFLLGGRQTKKKLTIYAKTNQKMI